MRLPEWALILMAAEAWGLPPWVVEAEAPALWLDRLQLFSMARETREILTRQRLINKGRMKPKRIFYVSDEPLMFARLAKKILGCNLTNIKKV